MVLLTGACSKIREEAQGTLQVFTELIYAGGIDSHALPRIVSTFLYPDQGTTYTKSWRERWGPYCWARLCQLFIYNNANKHTSFLTWLYKYIIV